MRPILLISIAVTVMAMSGCTSHINGAPTAQATPGTNAGKNTTIPPTSNPDDYGAPKVLTPLDASRFLKEPCKLLTPSQLQTLGLPRPGEPDIDSQIAKTVGPGCIWHGDSTPSTQIDVGFVLGNKNGLKDTYRAHQQGQFPGYFDPTTVENHPAVFNDLSDLRAEGTCNITVGISDTLTFRAAEGGTKFKGQASCDRAKQAASFMIQTMKAG